MLVGAPIWLAIALVAAAGVAWIALRNGWGRRRAATAALAALACAAAPSGIALRSAGGPVRIVALDDSGSMRASAEPALERLKHRLFAGGARVGVVRFAEGAIVAGTPAPAPLRYVAEIDRTASRTDIADALRRAAELLPPGGGEVVLITDGRVPASSLPGIAVAGRALRARGGRLAVVPAGPPAVDDAAAWSLRGPSHAPAGAAIRVQFTVRLSDSGSASVRLERDGTPQFERELTGAPRELRRLVFDDTPPATGVVRYRLTASAAGSAITPDAVHHNSARELVVTIGGERVVWICAGTPVPPGVLALARAADVRLVPKSPRSMPVSAGELAGVDAVILASGAREEFPHGSLRALAAYVERGGGLLQLGGPGAFGLAGFGGDPLERVSAVKSDPRTERPLALAVVLDASGSMAEPVAPNDPAAGTKIDAARAALEAALEQLRPTDRLYLVPFREGPLTPVELGAGATPGAAAALREALVARGGTHVRPAIEAAVEWLRAAKEPARQLVVVSDGRDPRLAPAGSDHAAAAALLLELLAEEIGASLLTSASEDGLSALVEGAAGRVVRLTEFSSVEQLLGRELRLSRGSLEWTGDAAPEAVTPLDALPVPAALPRVQRANRTVLSPGAIEVLRLAGDEPAPLLAVRDAGHGRSAAFTSSPDLAWAPRWGSGDGGALVAAALNYVLAGDRAGAVAVRATAEADRVRVVARWIGGDPADGRQLDLLDGDSRIALRPVGPARYAADAPLTGAARLVRLVEITPHGERPLGRVAMPGGWAAEWDGSGIDLDGCDRIAAAAGGVAVADAMVWQPLPLPGEAPQPIGGWLLGLGLMALLALFGLRRR